jgi:hypothetical protein
MATLVLSSVGSALGGPVGGAIGALIGQSVDRQLLGPSSRGPRLGDLKVQTSSYGTQIPRIYGRMRVAGSVIWATDLVESAQVSGAKGQPDSVYSYSVSFAVALSSRPIRTIGRIWADGKLLRGADGDLKVSTTLRIHAGDEVQELDPLIASVEGIANSPAYRGLALAVFENLELADFGNRIPFLTFEVLADETPSVGDILNDASGGLVDCPGDRTLIGFAAYGQHIKAAIEPLVEAFELEVLDNGSRLVAADAPRLTIADEELGNMSDDTAAARIQREQLPATALPSALRLGFYDPALDYQAGEARAASGERRGVEAQRELPAVVSAADAKSIAHHMIAREWADRDRLTVRLPPGYLALAPSSRVELNLTPKWWRVERCTIDGFVNVAELRPVSSGGAVLAADSGRIIAEQDIAAADVALALFDIPDVLGQGFMKPTLMLAASAASPGWKKVNVEIAAGSQRFGVRTGRKAMLGLAVTVPGPGDPYLVNRDGSFEIRLIDEDQWLVSCDDEALADGRNMAVLGSEVLQFGEAEPLGQGCWRLTRLLRGRAGTEWAMDLHAIGEPFAFIDGDALAGVALPSWSGATVSATVRNPSGTISVSEPFAASGESMRPVSPVRLDGSVDEAGNLYIAWTRRSRRGFAWLDEIDAPLGESSEQYRVTIAGSQDTLDLVTQEPLLSVDAAQLALVGPGQVSVEVRQIGDFGASRPARMTLTIPTGAA